MPRTASRHPTELELEILKIVWRDRSITVRHVRDALAPTRDLAYNSVQTIMQIMLRKGYLRKQKKRGGDVFSPRITEGGTSRKILRDLVKRVFGGSALTLVLNLLKAEQIDKEELDQIRELLKHPPKE